MEFREEGRMSSGRISLSGVGFDAVMAKSKAAAVAPGKEDREKENGSSERSSSVQGQRSERVPHKW